MSEQITINLTQPKEEITFAYTEQGEVITFSFSEAARGPQGEPGPDASVTNANVNAAIDDDPAATRAALELGSAALADTGTGASNVILGNDARLTDARTPTAHASSHVTGGTDKIRDASASQDGLMTTTFASKLNGIEAGADVTDSTNVAAAGAVMESDYTPSHSILVQQSGTGSPSSLSVGNNTLVGRLSGGGSAIDDLSASQVRTLLNVEDGADVTDAANVASTINGATAKTTPVDADEIPITDSAASFGLKKVTFANVFAYILTKLQAAASIVFTGQLRSTNQTAATGDALMTRDLGDERVFEYLLCERGFYKLLSTWGSFTNVGSGSGSLSTANGAFRISSGATSGGSSVYRANPGALLRFFRTNNNFIGIEWSRKVTLGWDGQIDCRTGGTWRLQFGRLFNSTTIGDLANTDRGIGLVLNGTTGALIAEASDGTTRVASGTLATLPNNAAFVFSVRLQSSGGTLTIWVNNVQVGTLAGAPTINSGTTANNFHLSIENGATSATYLCDHYETRIFISP
jgi:hypothetical protein